MSIRYRLTCEKCGNAYPVETSQSGGEITCECGTTLRIPTMLKMKRLEEWDAKETESSEAHDETNDASARETSSTTDNVATENAAAPNVATSAKPKKKLSAGRRGLLILAVVVFLGSLFMFVRNLPAPIPQMVFYRQTIFTSDGRQTYRDSTPPTFADYSFYYFKDYSDPDLRVWPVTDELIDRMNLFVCVQYQQNLRELDLSDNFYENYNTLKVRRLFSLIGYGALAFIALVVGILSLLVKENKKQVGVIRGSSWN